MITKINEFVRFMESMNNDLLSVMIDMVKKTAKFFDGDMISDEHIKIVAQFYIALLDAPETEFKKMYDMYHEMKNLDKKYGLGVVNHNVQYEIEKLTNGTIILEVMQYNNSQLWDREYREIYNNGDDAFKKRGFKNDKKYSYNEYKEELFYDLTEIAAKYSPIAGYPVRVAIAERTTKKYSDFGVHLINDSDYSYSLKKFQRLRDRKIGE